MRAFALKHVPDARIRGRMRASWAKRRLKKHASGVDARTFGYSCSPDARIRNRCAHVRPSMASRCAHPG
eukprot:11532227-Karenia_brevis.AAC.1